MEFTKERSVCNLIEVGRRDTCSRVFDEELHHLNTINIRIRLMHEVDVVLPLLNQVFLCHLTDGVSLVYDIIFSHLLVSSEDWEICPHDNPSHKSFLLIGNLIHQKFLLCIKCLEIGHDCRIINQGDLEHSGILIKDLCIIDRDSTNGYN